MDNRYDAELIIWGNSSFIMHSMDYLICPNCGGELTFLDSNSLYQCLRCESNFSLKNKVANLLPKSLEKTKINEEVRYGSLIDNLSPREALLHKSNEIRYLTEKVLPNHEFSGRLLDIGAGYCWTRASIKLGYLKIEVIASDVSPSALQHGIRVSELLNSDVDYYVACDCERLPFRSGLFDFVFSSATVHHWPRPSIGVSEIFIVLKKGGEYVGIGEIASNKFLKYIWKSRFGFFRLN